MRNTGESSLAVVLAAFLAVLLVAILLVPFFALVASTTPSEVLQGCRHPMFAPALLLSLRTTLASLVLTVVLGTPLAWWLAKSRSPLRRLVSALVELPIVIPPAVVGIALLQTFGRRGLLGPALDSLGMSLSFSSEAVILAQLVVSSPFYVGAARNAFRRLDDDAILVARTLGASSASAFVRVAVPIALPGLASGAALAWARALGEFGATLLFAGNLSGTTQTMPLAILSALESDVKLAVVFAVVLAAVGVVLLASVRGLGRILRYRLRKGVLRTLGHS